jgi:hypothetical protein
MLSPGLHKRKMRGTFYLARMQIFRLRKTKPGFDSVKLTEKYKEFSLFFGVDGESEVAMAGVIHDITLYDSRIGDRYGQEDPKSD